MSAVNNQSKYHRKSRGDNGQCTYNGVMRGDGIPDDLK